VRRLLSEMKTVGATLGEFGRHLKHVAMSMPGGAETTIGPADPLAVALASRMAPLAETIDQQLQDEFISQNGGLFQAVMSNSRIRTQMLAGLGRLARRGAEQLAARADVMEAALNLMEQDASASVNSAQQGTCALPQLLEHGGTYRTLIVAPDASAGRRMAASNTAAEGEPSVLTGAGNDVIQCCEAWDIPLERVAMELIERRRDYADFAGRVLTRNDVAWTSLTAPQAAPAIDWGTAGTETSPMMTQVL
jgi:hypothetical protein